MFQWLFQWLFTQYREPGKLHFGSKWMNLHGRLLIGSPESLGMGHLTEAVRRSFYYLRADRVPPVDNDAAYEAWTKDRLYASQVEQVAERWVAQAGFLVVAPLCAVLAVLAHWLGN